VRSSEQWGLTGRQLQLCLLLAGGCSLAQVAERLGVSRHTANYHCRQVYSRFDVHNRSELIAKHMAA
jgi:DNA-binding CsgD family transcriptional regulator